MQINEQLKNQINLLQQNKKDDSENRKLQMENQALQNELNKQKNIMDSTYG